MKDSNMDHQSIDLGLSVLWANKNMGASAEGDHYSWGTQHEWFSEKSYYSHFEDPIHNICDNPRFDIVRHEYGKPWRLPTASEFEELIRCCKWIWVEADDSMIRMAGYKVYGPNGNHIFLPAAGQGNGMMPEDSYVDDQDIYGCYWSGILCEDKAMPYELFFHKGAVAINKEWRSKGNSIRPVCTR